MRTGKFVLAAMMALVAGCGFRLQGALPMTGGLQRVTLQVTDGQSDFVNAMQRNLRNAGVSVETGSETVLVIERDELLERVASVSARNLPREYELSYAVRFSVKVRGEVRISSEDVLVTRDFSFDERLSLAKEREREQLRETLAEEAAGIVLQRLSSLR
ncbi:MAG: LPS assembly lipoprotein LptE [Gammaproteobacteria bacterium]